MKRLKGFIKTTVLGGMIVVLPVALTYVFLNWLFNIITGLIQPITLKVMEASKMQKFIADLMVILIIMIVCFIIGLIVKTKFGNFIHQTLEERILDVAPGYTLFKETIKQFLGKGRAPFSRVALVQIYENSTLMTGFITDQHPEGYYSVYVPSGLNPTTGLIYHLKAEFVHLLDISVEDAMRTAISCGGGSHILIDDYLKKTKVKKPLAEESPRRPIP